MKLSTSKNFLVSLVVLAAVVLPQFVFSGGAAEEPTPTGEVPGQVTLIIPYSAGGGTDQTGRAIARYFEDITGSNVVVVNREGAGGAFGMEEAIEADPTGETIALVPYPALVMTLEQTQYEAEDFDFLASFTQTPPALILAPDSRFSDLEELVKYARDNPGAVIASESGDSLLLSAVLFQDQAGIELTTVNYDGAGESLTALLGGHVDAAFISAQFIPTAQDEGATPVAIANDLRLDDLPDVPTYTEQGYEVVLPISRIIVAPQGLPSDTRSALIDALAQVGELEDFLKDLRAGGEVPRLLVDEEANEYVLSGAATIRRLRESYSEKFERE